jgi:hypothetical protein
MTWGKKQGRKVDFTEQLFYDKRSLGLFTHCSFTSHYDRESRDSRPFLTEEKRKDQRC